ncbi:MAG: putative 4-alpha-glucanotransferase [Frankiales bacterium]|nr:putative 4-alpha-glucanotransferase [Frankiales bacterium]
MTLHELAARCGVATSYTAWNGERRVVSDETLSAVLDALETAPETGPPPVVVVRRGEPVPLEGTALCEDGVRRELGPDLPLGYHAVGDTTLIVVPVEAPVPEGRHWGWQVQLYAVRSEGSWGMGDYADLRALCDATAEAGGSAVLINPVHAETPVVPLVPSPYSPSSRLFRSPLYLRVEEVPEYALATADVRARVDALRPPSGDLIDRDAVWTAKLAALEALWPGHRVGALASFRTPELDEFGRFCALAEVHGPDWRTWPAELAPAPERVSFWCWLQLLVDEQLAVAGEGLEVGVLHDLAVGVDGGGADAWLLRDVLAHGFTVGAPPDSLAMLGQDWGLPPWRPDRLRATAYQPFRRMVQAVLRHAGGIRIDHVMGLSRLWWVPAGFPAKDGTYVSYDRDAMLGVLALEAHRAGAVVVGEDLGTVEPSMRTALDSSGVLGSDVLWFQASDGSFFAPSTWRRDALATVTTHDLPTAAGWLAGDGVALRAALDQLTRPVEQERAGWEQERRALLAMLEHEGLLGDDLVLSLHRALVASPARLVLASLADAIGDLRQPNLPGTVDQYPNWRLPLMSGSGELLSLEQVLASDGVRRLTDLLRQVR